MCKPTSAGAPAQHEPTLIEKYQRPSTNESALDFAHRRIVQLSAILFMTYGEAGEAFRNANPQKQDNALWLAHDMAEEIEHAIDAAYKARPVAAAAQVTA